MYVSFVFTYCDLIIYKYNVVHAVSLFITELNFVRSGLFEICLRKGICFVSLLRLQNV